MSLVSIWKRLMVREAFIISTCQHDEPYAIRGCVDCGMLWCIDCEQNISSLTGVGHVAVIEWTCRLCVEALA